MALKTKLPRFKSEAEEASWWDRHPDILADSFERAAKKGELLRGVPQPGTVIRIPAKDAQAARRLAAHKGLSFQEYIKKLLRRALEEERLAS